MLAKAWTVSRINLRNLKVAWWTTAILALIGFGQTTIFLIMARYGYNLADNEEVSFGSYLYILIPVAAITIARGNLAKLINLGAKRRDYYAGFLLTYALLAAGTSLASLLVYQFYDQSIINSGYFAGVVNLIDAFGWSSHGLVVAFFQQFAWLFLVALAVHTVAFLQGTWLGAGVILALAAIISVFTPIAPLRRLEVEFFRLTIFHSQALIQIAACLALAGLLYLANRPALASRSL